jgi:hypothetical protein
MRRGGREEERKKANENPQVLKIPPVALEVPPLNLTTTMIRRKLKKR